MRLTGQASHSFAPLGVLARELYDSWSTRGALIRLGLFLLLAVVFVLQSVQYWQAVIDDSYITFRFVDMVTKGHGWRFSPGGPPVEGFTNFLWAVLLIPPHLMGWDLMFVSKVMGVTSGVVTMFAAWRLVRWVRGTDDLLNLLAPAILATNAHFAHWGMMGLETLMQCAFVTVAYWRFIKELHEPRLLPLSAIFALLAVLTRVDSLFYLSPLGLYGIWALVRGHATWRRALLWAAIAGLPFCVYTGWRVAYFGSLAPNTYWAKQRHILYEGRDRGHEQLFHYYLSQSGDEEEQTRRWERKSETSRLIGRSFGADFGSLPWMNLWLIGGAGAVLWMLVGGSNRVVTGAVLMPWLMNLYYIHHVNGDWMPSYRFFQVALPFLAVCFAAAIGRLACLSHRLPLRLGTGVVSLWLVLGSAWEQLQINVVYIFGRDSFMYVEREAGWWKPEGLSRLWNRGFAPPLREISEYLLLETQDDTWILMSDIGQPLWFSEHLNLYDVDGLVDPMLAHAPSMRGDLPPVSEIEERYLAQHGIATMDDETRDRVLRAARQADFELQVERNAAWLMEDRAPDYLLIFINHVDYDPRSTGYPYPKLSEQVYNHPAFSNYRELWTTPKVGNVFNHLYRRSDVATGVPPAVRLERIERAIQRNPRMPSLVALMLREFQLQGRTAPEEEKRLAELLSRTIRRFPQDPAVQELSAWARLGHSTVLNLAVQRALVEANPGDVEGWKGLADALEAAGDPAAASAALQEALPHAPEGDNSIHYKLGWLFEVQGRPEDAESALRLAIRRSPRDLRAWTDLGAMTFRVGLQVDSDNAVRLSWLKKSRTAFERCIELAGEDSSTARAELERIEAEIIRIEGAQP